MATRMSRFQRAAPALVDQRSIDRQPVSVTRATARTMGEEPAAAVLHDVSPFGCRLGVDEGHEPGERLWLRLGGSLPVAATVMWCEERLIGCRFDAPIARGLLRALTIGPVVSAA